MKREKLKNILFCITSAQEGHCKDRSNISDKKELKFGKGGSKMKVLLTGVIAAVLLIPSVAFGQASVGSQFGAQVGAAMIAVGADEQAAKQFQNFIGTDDGVNIVAPALGEVERIKAQFEGVDADTQTMVDGIYEAYKEALTNVAVQMQLANDSSLAREDAKSIVEANTKLVDIIDLTANELAE